MADGLAAAVTSFREIESGDVDPGGRSSVLHSPPAAVPLPK